MTSNAGTRGPFSSTVTARSGRTTLAAYASRTECHGPESAATRAFNRLGEVLLRPTSPRSRCLRRKCSALRTQDARVGARDLGVYEVAVTDRPGEASVCALCVVITGRLGRRHSEGCRHTETLRSYVSRRSFRQRTRAWKPSSNNSRKP